MDKLDGQIIILILLNIYIILHMYYYGWKMQIKNKNYKQFLDQGYMQILDIEHIDKAINNIKGKYFFVSPF